MKYFVTILSFFLYTSSFGQKEAYTFYKLNENQIVVDSVNLDFSSRIKFVDFVNEKYSQGYLSFGLDSFLVDSLSRKVYYYEGPQFFINIRSVSGINIKEDKLPRSIRLQEGKSVFSLDRIQSQQEQLLQFYENNGYPFVRFSFENVSIDSNIFQVDVAINKGAFFEIDSLIVKGSARINYNYIAHYLGIHSKDAYVEERIKGISSRLSDIPFLTETQPAALEFKNESVKVYTYLKEQKANRFNGIIGFLQDEDTPGKLQFTGDLELYLINAFKNGERVKLYWQRPDIQTQELQMNFSWPYLFKSSIGLEGGINFFKQDSTYFSFNPTIGARFHGYGENYFRVFYTNKASSILQNNSLTEKFASVNSTMFGFGFHLQKLDYLYNPSKGYVVDFESMAGDKNVDIEIEERLFQMESKATVKAYIPIYKMHVFAFSTYVGIMHSNSLYANELYRIGGFGSIRGVEEKSIFASAYGIHSFEYRFIFEKRSNFFVFYDIGFYQNRTQNRLEDTPVGFGTGINISTKAGVLSVSYAMGRQFSNPLLLKDAKVHVGYINTF